MTAEPNLPKTRTPADYAGLFARGFAMGAADVVPGVSGGTMAFILGIYEELVESLRMFGQPPFWRALARFELRRAIEIVNLKFLVGLGSGILVAILTLAKALEWLLIHRPVYVWSFFFGLVLASVVTVAHRVKRWNLALLLALIAGVVFAYVLVGLVPLQTPNDWWFLFLSGMVAICAMILPGISGAFVLVLLGKYQYVLSALNSRDFIPVFWVVAGAAIGIVSFAQVLGWFFKRYHDPTVALLTGLMLGSLRKVWPWKIDTRWIVDHHGQKMAVAQANVVPSAWTMEVTIALGLGVLGLVVVLVIDHFGKRFEA